MCRRDMFRLLFSLAGGIVIVACANERQTPVPRNDALLAKGQAVFAEKKCGSCHLNENLVSNGRVPSLLRPFLANDSDFVRAHLNFLDESAMPPMQLSKEEIRLLSYYVAHLHAEKHAGKLRGRADASCPVCGAPVASAAAKGAGLSYTYLAQTYYFECPECRDTFKQAPEAFRLMREWSDKNNK